MTEIDEVIRVYCKDDPSKFDGVLEGRVIYRHVFNTIPPKKDQSEEDGLYIFQCIKDPRIFGEAKYSDGEYRHVCYRLVVVGLNGVANGKLAVNQLIQEGIENRHSYKQVIKKAFTRKPSKEKHS